MPIQYGCALSCGRAIKPNVRSKRDDHTMTDSPFTIGAEGIDAQALVEQIRAAVNEKREKGLYNDPRIARAERSNLNQLKDDDDFLAFYLDCLKDAAFVDISDFEIVERRARCSGLLIGLKRTIWKLLKFYTYRLWSQQNQVNGLLLSAVENMESTHREKIAELETRIAELERCREPKA